MAGRAVYRKLAGKFGAEAAKNYLYGDKEQSGITKNADGELQAKPSNPAVPPMEPWETVAEYSARLRGGEPLIMGMTWDELQAKQMGGKYKGKVRLN